MTAGQRRFADEYLIDLNATRAYKAAYKSVKKDETARANASRLLTNANVNAYIDERMKDREQRTEITQDKVLKELASIAFANITNYTKVNNTYVNVKDTDKLSKQEQAAIAEIKQGKEGAAEVKLYDKQRALELLGKHLGMFTERQEVTHTITENNMQLLQKMANLVDDKK